MVASVSDCTSSCFINSGPGNPQINRAKLKKCPGHLIILSLAIRNGIGERNSNRRREKEIDTAINSNRSTKMKTNPGLQGTLATAYPEDEKWYGRKQRVRGANVVKCREMTLNVGKK